jgi:hypothetical protein
MKAEGGRMKGMLFKLARLGFKSRTFILHPSAFTLAFSSLMIRA